MRTYTTLFLLGLALSVFAARKGKQMTDREVWVDIMYQMAAPVMKNMAEGKLQQVMDTTGGNKNLELSPTWDNRDKKVAYMEAFGRLLAGVAPWLNLPDDDSPLDRPDSGTICVDGIDTTRLSQKKLADFRNRHIGFVFQFHQLLPEFTAIENIMIPAYIAGTGNKEARRRAAELLDFMGLSDRATHKPNELSGGEKQRVAVARALVNNPAVILADEPSGSLDSKNKAELHQLFFDLRNQFGQTFVIVTHDEQLATLTDRTIHLRDGVIESI